MRAGVDSVLERWQVGPGDLVITGGANGADIIISELAIRRGAAVQFLLAITEDEHVRQSVQRPGSDWETRYRSIRDRAAVRYQVDALGPSEAAEDPFVRNNVWMVDVGTSEAAPSGLFAVAVWDGRPGSVTSDFVTRVCAAGATLSVVALDGSLSAAGC